eukprot:TRINITY_DN332_c1_g3_i4.p1 TRINITY_DN332_c1_g3~~TRINITY_DN332_c1_g3_i4.p1  ORF type:complete len:2233 (+),score=587.66 TRINITY_DN332_c1_g3_i4:108-6806(+)
MPCSSALLISVGIRLLLLLLSDVCTFVTSDHVFLRGFNSGANATIGTVSKFANSTFDFTGNQIAGFPGAFEPQLGVPSIADLKWSSSRNRLYFSFVRTSPGNPPTFVYEARMGHVGPSLTDFQLLPTPPNNQSWTRAFVIDDANNRLYLFDVSLSPLQQSIMRSTDLDGINQGLVCANNFSGPDPGVPFTAVRHAVLHNQRIYYTDNYNPGIFNIDIHCGNIQQLLNVSNTSDWNVRSIAISKPTGKIFFASTNASSFASTPNNNLYWIPIGGGAPTQLPFAQGGPFRAITIDDRTNRIVVVTVETVMVEDWLEERLMLRFIPFDGTTETAGKIELPVGHLPAGAETFAEVTGVEIEGDMAPSGAAAATGMSSTGDEDLSTTGDEDVLTGDGEDILTGDDEDIPTGTGNGEGLSTTTAGDVPTTGGGGILTTGGGVPTTSTGSTGTTSTGTTSTGTTSTGTTSTGTTSTGTTSTGTTSTGTTSTGTTSTGTTSTGTTSTATTSTGTTSTATMSTGTTSTGTTSTATTSTGTTSTATTSTGTTSTGTTSTGTTSTGTTSTGTTSTGTTSSGTTSMDPGEVMVTTSGVAMTAGGGMPTTAGGAVPTTADGSVPTTAGGAVPTTAGGGMQTTGAGVLTTAGPTTVGGNIPTTAGEGVPTTAAGGVATTAGGAVPTTAAGTVPTTAGGGIPTTAGSSVPTTAGAGLPTTASGGIPTTAGSAVPTTAGAGIPTTAGGAMPTTAGGGIPTTVGGGTPTTAGGGTPSTAGGDMPMTAGAGVPTTAGGGVSTTANGGIPTTAGGSVPTTASAGISTTVGAVPTTAGATAGAGIPTTAGGPVPTSAGGFVPTTAGGGVPTTSSGNASTSTTAVAATSGVPGNVTRIPTRVEAYVHNASTVNLPWEIGYRVYDQFNDGFPWQIIVVNISFPNGWDADRVGLRLEFGSLHVDGSQRVTVRTPAGPAGTYVFAVLVNGVSLPGSVLPVTLLPAPAPQLLQVRFTDAANALVASFDMATNRAGLVGMSPCDTIITFAAPTGGGVGARCFWSSDDQLQVVLGSGATVLPGDVVRLKPGVLANAANNSLLANAVNKTVLQPTVPLVPTTVLVAPAQIADCATANLTLAADSSTGGAGRPMTFMWQVQPANDTTLVALMAGSSGPSVAVPASLLAVGPAYKFKVVARNFFNNSNWAEATVRKTASAGTPSVSILNANPLYVHRSETTTLQGDVQFSACASDRRALFQWRVWSGPPGVPVPAGSRDFRIPAYTLQANKTYVFGLTALPAANVSFPPSQANITVVVLPSAPLAVISGGTRQISVDYNILLDASGSLNFDGDPSALSFSWTCVDQYGAPCVSTAGPVLDLPASSSFVKPPGTLAPGTYRFTVKVTYAGLSDTASVLLYVVAGTPPSVRIAPLPTRKANPSQKLVLQGSATSPRPGSQLLYSWSVVSGQVVLSRDTLLAPPDGKVLSIQPNVLSGGLEYTFRLTVFDGLSVGFAEITVKMNQPPSFGSLMVQPPAGQAQATQFSLTTSGWSDDGDYPLQYRFSYFIGTDPSAAPETYLNVFSFQNSFGTIFLLPQNVTSNVTLVARAMDALGAVSPTYASFVVSVTPGSGGYGAFAWSFVDTISDTIGSGSVDVASRQIGLCANLLNNDAGPGALNSTSRLNLRSTLLDSLILSTVNVTITADLVELQTSAVYQIVADDVLPIDRQRSALNYMASLLTSVTNSSDSSSSSSSSLSTATAQSVAAALSAIVSSTNSSSSVDSQVASGVYAAAEALSAAQLAQQTCGEYATVTSSGSIDLLAQRAAPSNMASSNVSLGSTGSFAFGRSLSNVTSSGSDGCFAVQALAVGLDLNPSSVNGSSQTTLSTVVSITLDPPVGNISDGVLISFKLDAAAIAALSATGVAATCRYRSAVAASWTADASCEFVSLVGSLATCRCYHLTDFAIASTKKATTPPAPPPPTNETEVSGGTDLVVIIVSVVVAVVVVVGIAIGIIVFHRRRNVARMGPSNSVTSVRVRKGAKGKNVSVPRLSTAATRGGTRGERRMSETRGTTMAIADDDSEDHSDPQDFDDDLDIDDMDQGRPQSASVPGATEPTPWLDKLSVRRAESHDADATELARNRVKSTPKPANDDAIKRRASLDPEAEERLADARHRRDKSPEPQLDGDSGTQPHGSRSMLPSISSLHEREQAILSRQASADAANVTPSSMTTELPNSPHRSASDLSDVVGSAPSLSSPGPRHDVKRL